MWSHSYAYDTETYPNVFTCGIVHMDTGTRWIFEISHAVDQSTELVLFLERLCHAGCEMVGFNNEGFDYPILHLIAGHVRAGILITPEEIYNKAMQIIRSPRGDFSHSIPEWERLVPQIDLFKIMHFDNFARATSLKKLEIAMKSKRVEDLPFEPGTILDEDQKKVLIEYMCYDIDRTGAFAKCISDRISLRRDIGAETSRNVMNFNDTRIGKQTFIDELEKEGVICYERSGDGKRSPRQTHRENIQVSDKLLPVSFETSDLQRIYQFFQRSTIPGYETKGFFKDLSATCGDLNLHFGSGGLHGSVSGTIFDENDEFEIIDVDVESYYPSLAIAYGFYPEHLGSAFCSIYANLKQRRISYPKGSPQNAALKLALNGVYGDSNNVYSPFYDPAYTMAITINGQLLLARLAEQITLKVPRAKLIQANTDGITIYSHRGDRGCVEEICADWQNQTRLKLEFVNYRRMAIRDVNNYVAIGTDGKVKRKNAYLTEPDWHQNHSSLVVAKAANAWIIDGTDVRDFVFKHVDRFDFMRHIKVPRNMRLEWGDDVVQNTSRYFISLGGRSLRKIMPPLKGQTSERISQIDKGWDVEMCNDLDDFDWRRLNRRFYVQEARKLTECFTKREGNI